MLVGYTDNASIFPYNGGKFKLQLHSFLYPLDKVTVNEATIIESEVFVYNLGTMFYIDKVLFTNRNSLPPTTPTSLPTTENAYTTAAEAESVPMMPDIYVADEEAATAPPVVEVSTKNATSVK